MSSTRRRGRGGATPTEDDIDDPEEEREMEKGHSRMVLLFFCGIWSVLSVIATIIFAVFAANQRQSNLTLLSVVFACLLTSQAVITFYSENTQPMLTKAVTKGFGRLFRNPPRMATFVWLFTTIGALIVYGFLISALVSSSAATTGTIRTAGLITFIIIGVAWLSISVGLLFSSVFRDIRLRVGGGWEELHETR